LGRATRTGRSRIAPGSHPLSIGDRIGSLYHGFPGYLTQVRLCQGALEFRPITLAAASDRSVFIRMEKTPSLRFMLTNAQRQTARDVSVSCSIEGRETSRTLIPELAPGASRTLEVPVDTALRPGVYALRVRVVLPGKEGHEHYVSDESATFTLVPRRPPRMPVVMWGLYGAANVLRELPRLTEIGFTHCLGFGADYGRVFEAGCPVAPDTPERVAEVKRMLDTALAHHVGIIATLSPGHWASGAKAEFRRVDRSGARNDKKPALCAAFPTIAPMHLREAFWTKLARPARGIMYHGWGSLVPQSGESAYRYTHPQTQHELRRLIKERYRAAESPRRRLRY